MDAGEIVNSVFNWCGDAFAAFANNLDAFAFCLLAAIGIAAAIMVVTSKEIMHSAFYLALVFTTVAATYYFLNSEMVGVIQMMVYVGAITILFAFSIMLTRRSIIEEED